MPAEDGPTSAELPPARERDPAQRVVVTGMGAVTALGRGVDTTFAAMREGRSGIRRITRFDPTKLPCEIAGEVDTDDLLPPHELDALGGTALRLYRTALEEALHGARVPEGVDPRRVAVVLGGHGYTPTEDEAAVLLRHTDGDGRVDAAALLADERYASEHPGVVAPSLAHAICHHDAAEGAGSVASNAEEATLHGVLAGVHAWLLSREPALADLGTELSRRQASLTITLLNARVPGSPRPGIVCPDGPGTIPGGNPDLQCPDLWSIPFTSAAPADCELAIPDAVRRTLALMADGGAGAVPGNYDGELRDWLSANGCGGMLSGPTVDPAGRSLGLWG